MEKFVEIETHLHTISVSPCSRIAPEEAVRFYKNAGYYGVFITDHFTPFVFEQYFLEDKSWEQQADYFLRGYRAAKKLGDKIGLKVFLGMEICLRNSMYDFLAFGADEEFIYRTEALCDMSLPAMSSFLHENGLLIFQAHPYRYGQKPANPAYYDGIEVFNSHPRHESRNALSVKFAKDNNIWVCAGSDAHSINDMGRSGVMLPPIESSKEFADYYKQNGSPELIIICG